MDKKKFCLKAIICKESVDIRAMCHKWAVNKLNLEIKVDEIPYNNMKFWKDISRGFTGEAIPSPFLKADLDQMMTVVACKLEKKYKRRFVVEGRQNR